jgi:hypothetical protein
MNKSILLQELCSNLEKKMDGWNNYIGNPEKQSIKVRTLIDSYGQNGYKEVRIQILVNRVLAIQEIYIVKKTDDMAKLEEIAIDKIIQTVFGYGITSVIENLKQDDNENIKSRCGNNINNIINNYSM